MSPTGNVYYYNDTNLKDKVTNISGDTITYDQSGNPMSYRDIMSFTWQNGRQLASLQTADNNVSYKYDSNGMRTQKTNNSGTTYYYYDSGNNLIGMTKGNNTLLFYYDSDGNVTSFKYGGTMYYYIKNLQGDIVKIINQASSTVYASYVYDAWGNVKSVSVSRYQERLTCSVTEGMYMTRKQDWYYLKSRYYDPETGRFINADIYCDTMSNIFGTNMFTYCNNNPVNQIDPEGTDAMWLQFPDGANGFGHTSLLIQDTANCWWYFYWGDKRIILRPCGKDDFTIAELNSYLAGFDPRPGHNYYVKAYNSFYTKYTIAERLYDSSIDSTLCKDGTIQKSLYFNGDFSKSLRKFREIFGAVVFENNINIRDAYDYYYENGKKLFAYSLKNNSKYNLINMNCVQVSIGLLLEGTFEKNDWWAKYILTSHIGKAWPNVIYDLIWIWFSEGEEKLYEG